jgi:hypothetical protein
MPKIVYAEIAPDLGRACFELLCATRAERGGIAAMNHVRYSDSTCLAGARAAVCSVEGYRQLRSSFKRERMAGLS